jgi:hypothetical protein
MVRDGYDQHLSVDPCHLQYVYQDQLIAVGLLTKQ